MNKSWIISKNKKNKIEFISDDIGENLIINEGINFLIGKNNSGKSKILESLKNKSLLLSEDGEKIHTNRLFFKSSSKSIEDENVTKNSIFEKNSIQKFLEDYESTSDDITEKIFEGISRDDDEFKEFISNKKIIQNNSFTTKIDSFIDGVSSSESGSGENRITYLLYSVVALIEQINDVYEKIQTNYSFLYEYIDKVDFNKEEIEILKNFIDNIIPKNKEDNNSILTNGFNWYNNGSSLRIKGKEAYDHFKLFIEYIKRVEKHINASASRLLFNLVYNIFDFSYAFSLQKGNVEDERRKVFNDEEWKIIKEFYGLIEYLGGKESYKYNKPIKEKVINDYWKVKMGNEEETSLRFLLLIDEPELYIHSSKYKFINKLFNYILSIGDYDIRILITTHDERIIKGNSKYIENTNIVYKDNEKVEVKNIFDNDINNFICKIRDDYKKYFKEIDKSNLDDNARSEIDKEISLLSKQYIDWFISYKDNMKIFFTDKVFIVEGFHDRLVISEMLNKMKLYFDEVIEADGTYLGMLIWINLIKINIRHFKKISFLVDLDLKKRCLKVVDGKCIKSEYKLKAQTHLIRKYISNVFKGNENVELYSSLFNDVTEWIAKEKMIKDFLIENNDKIEIAKESIIKSKNNNTSELHEWFKWVDELSTELTKNLNNLKDAKKIIGTDYEKYKFAKEWFFFTGKWNLNSRSNRFFNKMEIFSSLSELSDEFILDSRENNFNSNIKNKNGRLYVNYNVEDEMYECKYDQINLSDNFLISKHLNYWTQENIELKNAENFIIDLDNKKYHFLTIKEIGEYPENITFKLESLLTESYYKISENKMIKGIYKVELEGGTKYINTSNSFRKLNCESEEKLIDSFFSQDYLNMLGTKTHYISNNWNKYELIDETFFLSIYFENLYNYLSEKEILVGPLKRSEHTLESLDKEIKNIFKSWVEIK